MSQSVAERLSDLQQRVAELLADVEHVPDAVLYRAPGPDAWPIMSTLAHVAEVLPYWAAQATHIVRNPGAPFGRTHEDPNRIAAVEAHAEDARSIVLGRIREGLAQAVAALEAIPAEAWARTGQHARRGTMSVEQVFDDFILGHVEEHRTQVQAALKALAGYSSQVP